jgi:hypothetical protein
MFTREHFSWAIFDWFNEFLVYNEYLVFGEFFI